MRTLRLMALAIVLLALPALAQDGYMINADEVQALGRGATQIGVADTSLSLNHNPAGLAFIDSTRLDLSIRMFASQMRYKSPFESGANGDLEIMETVPIVPNQGFAWTNGIRENDIGFAAGVAMGPIAGGTTDIEFATDIYPQGVNNFTHLQVAALMPGGAIRFGDVFSVGGSLVIARGEIDLDGLIEQPAQILNGQINLPTANLAALPQIGPVLAVRNALPRDGETFGNLYLSQQNRFDTVRGIIDYNEAEFWGIGARIGIMFRPVENFQIGVTYSPKVYFKNFSTNARIDFSAIFNQSGQRSGINRIEAAINALGAAFGDPVLANYNVIPDSGVNGLVANYRLIVKDLTLPMWVGAGASWTINDLVRLSVEGKWIQWSQSFSKVDVELKNGDNPDLNALIGGSGFQSTLPLGWTDQYIFGLGAEFFLGDQKQWTLRTGYRYTSNPIRTGFASPQIPAFLRNHISAGGSYTWGNWQFHAGYTVSLDERVSVSRHRTNDALSNSITEFGLAHFAGVGATYRFGAPGAKPVAENGE